MKSKKAKMKAALKRAKPNKNFMVGVLNLPQFRDKSERNKKAYNRKSIKIED